MGIQEAELRDGLRVGGEILGLLVVARDADEPDAPEYAIYVRPSWSRGYRILRTWRDRGDRTFRSLDKLFNLRRSLGYEAPVTVYPRGCPELRKFRGVLPEDGGARGAGPPGQNATVPPTSPPGRDVPAHDLPAD